MIGQPWGGLHSKSFIGSRMAQRARLEIPPVTMSRSKQSPAKERTYQLTSAPAVSPVASPPVACHLREAEAGTRPSAFLAAGANLGVAFAAAWRAGRVQRIKQTRQV